MHRLASKRAITLRHTALAAISIYQRYISPYKGFCCAYRVHTGRSSCSVLGYRAIRRHGIFAGLALLKQRTYRCSVVHESRRDRARHAWSMAGQRGACDLDCNLPCDLSCDGLKSNASGLCDMLSCCDCSGCDWPSRKKGRDDDRRVRIPPKPRDRTPRKQPPSGG